MGGLDEYFIKYRHQNDAHWVLQSWFDRFVVLNNDNDGNGVVNNFMNHYIVSTLMMDKLDEDEKKYPFIADKTGRCSQVEAMVDVMYAIQVIIDSSEYKTSDNLESLHKSKDDIWNGIKERYKVITLHQRFESKFQRLFIDESSFDGSFISDVPFDGPTDHDVIRLDGTQHCVCALMKLNMFLYFEETESESNQISYSYTDHTVMDETADNGLGIPYDLVISLSCLMVVLILVIITFAYWCHYYPKLQKERNDIFDLGKTLSIESYALTENADIASDFNEEEFVAA